MQTVSPVQVQICVLLLVLGPSYLYTFNIVVRHDVTDLIDFNETAIFINTMHGTNDVKNTWHPNIIFKKNKDGTYNKNALLCQDILRYCINGKHKEGDNESFRIWNLKVATWSQSRIHKPL